MPEYNVYNSTINSAQTSHMLKAASIPVLRHVHKHCVGFVRNPPWNQNNTLEAYFWMIWISPYVHIEQTEKILYLKNQKTEKTQTFTWTA